MNYFTYVFIVVALFVPVLHASQPSHQSKGQVLVIVGGTAENVFPEQTGTLTSCSFVPPLGDCLDDSVGMAIERELTRPQFITLQPGSEEFHFSAKRDSEGRVHVYEKTKEVSQLKEQIREVQESEAQAQKALLALKKKQDRLSIPPKVAVGVGLGVTSIALFSLLCGFAKTTASAQ